MYPPAPDRPSGQVGSAAFFAALGLASVLCWLPVAAAGRQAALPLVYQRPAVLQGQVWRLLTAHLVNLSGAHLAWNLAALAAIGLLVGPALRAAAWLRVALVIALATGLGLLLLRPGVLAMAGLSALLHGLLAGGALAAAAGGRRLGFALLVVLTAKLVAEQLAGPLPWSAAAVGGGIAVDAHLYGALGGLAAAAAELLRRRLGTTA